MGGLDDYMPPGPRSTTKALAGSSNQVVFVPATARNMKPDRERKREDLISQMNHLVQEVDALREMANSLHDDALSVSPLQHEPSIKELYALIGLYDQNVYLPAIRTTLTEERPRLAEGADDELLKDRDWNNESFCDVLDFVRRARIELLNFLKTVSPDGWEREAILGERTLTLFEVAYAVVQHDALILQAAALRFHDSRWLS